MGNPERPDFARTSLSKLEWVRNGGSIRQLEDAGTVVDVQGAALDWPDMDLRAQEIGVSDLLAKLREGAAPTE